jgi:hypothetical protein
MGSTTLKPKPFSGSIPICSRMLCWVLTPPLVSMMSAAIVLDEEAGAVIPDLAPKTP